MKHLLHAAAEGIYLGSMLSSISPEANPVPYGLSFSHLPPET